jgi:hypothetical protein
MSYSLVSTTLAVPRLIYFVMYDKSGQTELLHSMKKMGKATEKKLR